MIAPHLRLMTKIESLKQQFFVCLVFFQRLAVAYQHLTLAFAGDLFCRKQENKAINIEFI